MEKRSAVAAKRNELGASWQPAIRRRRMAEEAPTVHVVGPVRHRGRWIFACPECDDHIVALEPGAPFQCTADWLAGRDLSFDNVNWTCWAPESLEERGLQDKRKRFLYYSAIARELGAVRRRVDLPRCVKEKIEEQHGESQTGFKDGGEEEEEAA